MDIEETNRVVQGHLSSLIEFNIFTSNILQKITMLKVKMLLYADEMAILINSRALVQQTPTL